MNQRFDIHVVFRSKRVKQGFRGTQLETMKSYDFLCLALLGIVAVYYDNLFVCSNQSVNVILRGFVILAWILTQQEAISQKEIVFRFRKDIQSEKGWRFDILCMRSPGVKGICADALLCDSLSCQSLRFVVEARYNTEPIQ